MLNLIIFRCVNVQYIIFIYDEEENSLFQNKRINSLAFPEMKNVSNSNREK